MAKIGDLVITTGSYEKDGQTKKKYKNIGVLMSNQDGGQYILLDKCFNPAGVNQGDGKESILISIYDNSRNNQPQQMGQQQGNYQEPPVHYQNNSQHPMQGQDQLGF